MFQLDGAGRQQKIFRIALAADFVSEFSCSGINNKKFSVLFIGPEQRRVLVVPRIPEPSLLGNGSPEFLQSLNLPAEFPVLDCVPPLTLNQWIEKSTN